MAIGVAPATAADPVGAERLSAVPPRVHPLFVSPARAFVDRRGGIRIGFETTGSGPVEVLIRILGSGGEVRRLTESQVAGGVERIVTWDGLSADGRPVPDGAYRVLIGEVGGAEQKAGGVNMFGHFYPVRAPHGRRGGVGEFHAPRNGGRIHAGFDITAGCGRPLAAVRSGTVLRRGFDPVLYGNFILIKGLGEGASYFYAHMVRPSPFRRGERVHTADTVGRIGQTGNAAATPCHLHFEVRVQGRPVDPEPLLRKWDRQS